MTTLSRPLPMHVEDLNLIQGWIDGLVSVVMPAYNSEKVLAKSIESVVAQTYADWELLIIDDCSRDATAEIARLFAEMDSRIRVIRLELNRGAAHARNCGIKEARGRYVAFLDSDDQWLPEKLSIQMEFLSNRGEALCFSAYRRFGLNSHREKLVRAPERVSYDDLLGGNVIGCLTVLIDRSRVGDFRMPAIRHEDYAAWLSILRQGHIAWGIQEELARYHLSESSLSGNKLRAAVWTWRIYRHAEDLNLLKACCCFARYALRALCVRWI